MSVQANMTCANRQWQTSIVTGIGTRAKMLVDHTPGGLTLPDNGSYPASMPQVTRGGQRIIGGVVTSTDGTARDVVLLRGSTLTTQSTATTGTLAVATTSSISRTAGDFRADGWTVGDTIMVFGPAPTTFGALGTPDYSNNAGTLTALSSVGVLGVITAVAALTITVNGTPLTAESLPGCRLIRVAQSTRQTIAASAGAAAATPAQILIGNTNEPDINNLLAADRGLSLGATEVLLVASAAAISALPAQLNFCASSVVF